MLAQLRYRRFRLGLGRRLGRLGRRSIMVQPATVTAPHRVEIGDNVLIFENAHFSVVEEFRGRRHEPRLTIGCRTVVGPRAWFSCVGRLSIGDDVLIGAGVLIADSFHEFRADQPVIKQPMAPAAGVEVGSGSFVGAGAALLAGTRIGHGSVVLANAVVAGEFPPHSVIAGNPAKVISHRLEAGGYANTGDPSWETVLASLGLGQDGAQAV